jgi:DNA polymerase-1
VTYTGHLYAGSVTATYTVGDGAAAVRLAQRADAVAVDTETRGLGADAWKMHCVQIGTADEAHLLDPEQDRAAIVDVLTSAKRLIVHNASFDVPILHGLGLMRRGDTTKVWDTLVAARLAAPSERGGHDLDTAYKTHCPDRWLGDKDSLAKRWREVTGKSKAEMFRTLGMESEAFCQYAARDVVMTAELARVLPAAHRAFTLDHPFRTSGDPGYLMEREQTVNRMMLAGTCAGIEIDFEVIDELEVELRREVHVADAVLAAHGIDIDLSPPKVKEAAMDVLSLLGEVPASYPRLQSGRPSADARHLRYLEHPIIEHLVARSKALRFIKDYAGDKILRLTRDGRIHPQVAVATAVTGRMSIKEPPLQQYPGRVRRMMRFDTPATSLDWASIEPVLFANLTGEVGMITEFEAGGDLYLPIAEAAGVSRKVAKVVLLAQFYGQGRRQLAWQLGIDEDQAGELVARVMSPLTAISGATKAIRAIGDSYGKAQTLSGRICPLDADYQSGNRKFLGYKAVNYVVQGGAYDLLAEVLYETHRRGLADAIYIAVHDELVVAADAADEVEEVMRTPPPALIEAAGRTPVLRVGRTELGQHWAEKEG